MVPGFLRVFAAQRRQFSGSAIGARLVRATKVMRCPFGRRRHYLALRVILMLAGFVTMPAIGHAAEPQQWSEFKVVATWTPNVDLFAATTLRIDEKGSAWNRVSGQLGVNLRLARQLTVSPSYQYIVFDPTDDATNENRPGIVLAFRVPIGSAEMILSSGVEYRIRDDKPDTWRVRPKLKLKQPLGPRRWHFSGYLADELFFDTTEADFVRNRFYAGLEKKLRENWSADIYYCRQHDIRSCEPDLNIFGISITLHFDIHPTGPPYRE